jgi:hypothetical protein
MKRLIWMFLAVILVSLGFSRASAADYFIFYGSSDRGINEGLKLRQGILNDVGVSPISFKATIGRETWPGTFVDYELSRKTFENKGSGRVVAKNLVSTVDLGEKTIDAKYDVTTIAVSFRQDLTWKRMFLLPYAKTTIGLMNVDINEKILFGSQDLSVSKSQLDPFIGLCFGMEHRLSRNYSVLIECSVYKNFADNNGLGVTFFSSELGIKYHL